MTEIEQFNGNCGIYEIFNFDFWDWGKGVPSNPTKEVLYVCQKTRLFRSAGMYVFSDSKDREHGVVFAKFLKDNHLGKVTQTRWVKNPNSGNLIKMWTFIPDTEAIKVWYSRNSTKKLRTTTKKR